MNTLKTLLLGLLFLSALVAKAEESTEELVKFEDMPQTALFASINLIDHPEYYGSALVWDVLPLKRGGKISGWRLVFVANVHTIPQGVSPSSFSTIFGTYGEKKKAQRVQLGPTAAPMDLAFWYVDLPSSEFSMAAYEALKVMCDKYYQPVELPTKKVRLAILGNPDAKRTGQQSGVWVHHLSWSKRALGLKAAEPKKTRAERDRLFSDPVDIEVLVKGCPIAPYLRACIRAPMPSSGYSGSPVVVTTDEALDGEDITPIAGLVYGFEPLSDRTYIIPIKEILRLYASVKQYLEGEPRKAEVVFDGGRVFQYTGDGAYLILAGSRKGDTLSASEKINFGGGMVSGGGGMVSGGGGKNLRATLAKKNFAFLHPKQHTPKDPNEREPNSLDVVVTEKPLWTGSLASLDFKGLISVLDTTFLYKGIRKQFDFVPGIDAGGKRYHTFNGEPILSLPQFMRAYMSNPNGLLEENDGEDSEDDALARLPANMQLEGDDRLGLAVSTSLQSLKSAMQVLAIEEKHHTITNNSLHLSNTVSRMLAEALVQSELDALDAKKAHATFFSTLRHDWPDWSPITAANYAYDKAAGNIVFEHYNPDHKVMEKITVPAKLKRVGPGFFTYTGACDISGYDKKSQKVHFPGTVQLVIEKVGCDNHYEAKLVYAFIDPRKQESETGLFDPYVLQVRGVYLPLVVGLSEDSAWKRSKAVDTRRYCRP